MTDFFKVQNNIKHKHLSPISISVFTTSALLIPLDHVKYRHDLEYIDAMGGIDFATAPF